MSDDVFETEELADAQLVARQLGELASDMVEAGQTYDAQLLYAANELLNKATAPKPPVKRYVVHMEADFVVQDINEEGAKESAWQIGSESPDRWDYFVYLEEIHPQ